MEIKEQNTHTPPPSRALTQELRDTTQCRRGRRPGALLRHLPTVHRGTPGPEHPELGDDLVNGQLWSVFNLCSSEQGRRSSVLERGQSSCLASAIDLLGELFFFFCSSQSLWESEFPQQSNKKKAPCSHLLQRATGVECTGVCGREGSVPFTKELPSLNGKVTQNTRLASSSCSSWGH